MLLLLLFFALPISLYCPETPLPSEDAESKMGSLLVKPTPFADPHMPEKQALTGDEDSTSAEGSPETHPVKIPESASKHKEDQSALAGSGGAGAGAGECAGAGCGSSKPQQTRRTSRPAIVGCPPLLPKQTTPSASQFSADSTTTIERIFAIENKDAEEYFERHPGFHDLWVRKHELVTIEIKELYENLEKTSEKNDLRSLKRSIASSESFCDRLAILINPFHYGQKQGELIYQTLNKSEWQELDRRLEQEVSRIKRIIAETETPFRDMTEERDLVYFIVLKVSFLSAIYEHGPYLKDFNYEQAGRENGFDAYHKRTYDELFKVCLDALKYHEIKLEHSKGNVALKHLAMIAYWRGLEEALSEQKEAEDKKEKQICTALE